MVPLFAAAGIVNTASKIIDGAASVWKHATAGAHAGGSKAAHPGSFASLLSGLGVTPTTSGQDLSSTVLTAISGKGIGAARGGATGTGAGSVNSLV